MDAPFSTPSMPPLLSTFMFDGNGSGGVPEFHRSGSGEGFQFMAPQTITDEVLERPLTPSLSEDEDSSAESTVRSKSNPPKHFFLFFLFAPRKDLAHTHCCWIIMKKNSLMDWLICYNTGILQDIRDIDVDNLCEEDEEKMWLILHTLEEWKVRSFCNIHHCSWARWQSDSCAVTQKSKNAVLRNQKLISEMKATLLPLLAALNRPQGSPSNQAFCKVRNTDAAKNSCILIISTCVL